MEEGRFGILLDVRITEKTGAKFFIGLCSATLAMVGIATGWAKPQNSSASPAQGAQSTNSAANSAAETPQTSSGADNSAVRRAGLNMVVLDPAHGGTDLGARGTEGIRESEVVLQFAAAVRKALEAQGFQVVMTRGGNENPSFDDRSGRANAQRGAVFITLHVGSTGLAGTARVYVTPEVPPLTTDTTGMIPWDRAQGPFVVLSHRLGDLVQMELAKRFKGSPDAVQVAPVRQLRTTAAPAIAVEISSVSVKDRAQLDRMVPGVAEAIVYGVAAFRPSYVIPSLPGSGGGMQP